MKADRDSFIILLTFVPIVVGLLLFMLWRTTGSGPFDLPSVDFSGIPLPNVGFRSLPMVSGIADGARRMTRDAKSLAIGIGIGIVAGVILAGILIDVIRGVRKLSTPGPRPGERTGTRR